MSEDKAAELEAWWESLSRDQQAELLPLEEGDPLPWRYLQGLTNALGVGLVGTKWESDPGFTFRVDSRLGPFLEGKRHGTSS